MGLRESGRLGESDWHEHCSSMGRFAISREGSRRKMSRNQRKSKTTDQPAQQVPCGLRYTLDDRPGIRRVRAGKGFRYLSPESRPVLDAETLGRIRSLAIPPAWTDVWICPHANGHLQATGRDARGRKQYRYHPRWRATRDETKFDRLIAFCQALPRLRERVEADLSLP